MKCKTTAPSGVAEAIIPPAEIAGIPTERLRPMRDGSVVEYDRPVFTEAEGVGRYSDPEKQPVHTHPPGSEVAEALRPIMEARRAPRPATRLDAHMHDEAALLEDCQAHEARKYGLAERATKHAARARRHKRRAWMIRRHLNTAEHAPTTVPLDTPRPTALASPREHRARRSSSPSRAGPSDDEGPSDEPPPAGRLCQLSDCDRELPPERRKYCCDPHAELARKRAQRERDRLEPDRVADRRLVLLTETKAPPHVRCKCDPKGHLVDGDVCVPCGRARGNRGVAWLAGDISSRQLSVHQPSRAREWRTRPSRSESARLRSTRRDYIDESIIKAVAA